MIHTQLPALANKISAVLTIKPECFITHPAELRLLHCLDGDELRDLTQRHGWRVVQRVGGRQIEFYNDAGVLYRPL